MEVIKLTEKNDAEKYDFLKLKDYICYDICYKLMNITLRRVLPQISVLYLSLINFI